MRKTIYLLLASFGLGACNYLDIEPVGKVIPHKVTEFRALMVSGYQRYPWSAGKCYTGLLSDEADSLYKEEFFGDEGVPLEYNLTWQYDGRMREYEWRMYYHSIFLANSVIGGVMGADQDSEESKEQIMAEAYAMRAYNHFELVNLYAKWYDPATAATDKGVPISIYTDIERPYEPNTVTEVYGQIVSDLDSAALLMQVDVQTDVNLNYRFTKKALKAFDARVRLYMQDWQKAYDVATSLLPVCELQNLEGITGYSDKKLPWKATSVEAILALDRPFAGGNGDLRNAAMLSDQMLGLLDPTDYRRNFIKKKNRYENMDYANPILVGYSVDRSSTDRISIRSAEVWLIAAEAAAHLPGKLQEAKNYLTEVQKNRFTPEGAAAKKAEVDAMDEAALLTEIYNERAREFLMEGHGWFDLRRTTRPRIEKIVGGSTYVLQQNDSRYVLPYPFSAVESNPELGK